MRQAPLPSTSAAAISDCSPCAQQRVSRRKILQVAAGAAVLIASGAKDARAQSFPSRPITLIVPYPPGGPTDSQFRALADAASKILGQPIIIMNKPGNGGALGPVTMAQLSTPDGYTVAVLPASLFRLPHLQKSNWDPLKDFTYVIGLTSYTYGITVSSESRWKTLEDLLSEAKQKPSQLSYGATGAGTAGHIVMERLNRAAGVKMTFAPFKGVADWQAALLGGHIDAVSDPGWGALAKGGKVRVLATATAERVKTAGNVPTLRELGYDVVMVSMLGIGGPKGMNPAVVKVLHDTFYAASKDSAYLEILRTENQPDMHLDAAAYASYAAQQFESDRKSVKELGITLD